MATAKLNSVNIQTFQEDGTTAAYIPLTEPSYTLKLVYGGTNKIRNHQNSIIQIMGNDRSGQKQTDQARTQMSDEHEKTNTTQGRTMTNHTYPYRQTYASPQIEIDVEYHNRRHKQPLCRHRERTNWNQQEKRGLQVHLQKRMTTNQPVSKKHVKPIEQQPPSITSGS